MMDATSMLMFAVIFLMGFVFSFSGIFEVANSIDKKRSSFTAIVCNLIASIIWFPFTLIWFTTADVTMYFGFGYLWLALAFAFLTLTLLSIGLQLRYSVKPEEKEALTIRERVM